MMHEKQTVLVATAKAFQENVLLEYGEAVAKACGAGIIRTRLTDTERFSEEFLQFCSYISPVVVVAHWPSDNAAAQDLHALGKKVKTLIIDPRQHSAADVRRVVAPWSGNPHSLERLRLASSVAAQLGVPGHVLRIVSTEGVSSGRVARYLEQVCQRELVELALAGVTMPTLFRSGDDPVGETLVRLTADDMVFIGSSKLWRLGNAPIMSISQDIHSSVAGPVAMLLEPSMRTTSLLKVFQERCVLIRSSADPVPIMAMLDLLISQRQVPWRLKPLIMSRVRTMNFGKQVVLAHAQVPQPGHVIGSICVSPNADEARVAFLLLVPEEGYNVYLPVLAKLAEWAASQESMDAVLQCETPAEVLALMQSAGATPRMSSVAQERA